MIDQKKILIIKLSAFGDFIQALGPMAAIRRAHADDHITLLTTKPFKTLGSLSTYVNDIMIDERPSMTDLAGWSRLIKALRGGHFDRVYDLQGNDRTALYCRAMLFLREGGTEWYGPAPAATHRDTVSNKKTENALTRHRRLLGMAGITPVEADPMRWVSGNITRFDLPQRYALLVPGCAPDRLEKRWPAERYGAIARKLAAMDVTPVIVGSKGESPLGETIRATEPSARNLCGETEMMELVLLARGAAGAVGNDTGPMHVMGPVGCPLLVLFSKASSPALHAPNGPDVRTIQVDDLNDLPAERVSGEIRQGFLRY